MSSTSTLHAHIAYDLIDTVDPKVLVVEFLSHTIMDPLHAAELGQQLGLLIRPDLPTYFVLDFKKVRSLGSHAFGALVSFALKVRQAGGHVNVCNVDDFLRLGADMSRLSDHVEFAPDRQSAMSGFGEAEILWATNQAQP
jgi:anti-anti-sigma factor